MPLYASRRAYKSKCMRNGIFCNPTAKILCSKVNVKNGTENIIYILTYAGFAWTHLNVSIKSETERALLQKVCPTKRTSHLKW